MTLPDEKKRNQQLKKPVRRSEQEKTNFAGSFLKAATGGESKKR